MLQSQRKLLAAAGSMRPLTGKLARRRSGRNKSNSNSAISIDEAHPQPHIYQSLKELPKIKARCVMINVYAGTLLVSYPLLVESARRNPQTTWLLVHLGPFGSAVDLTWSHNFAPNFILVQTTVEELVALSKRQLVPEGENPYGQKPAEPVLTLKHGYKLNVSHASS